MYGCWLWCRTKGAKLDTTKPFLGSKSHSRMDERKDLISLVDLSELSGFPTDLIKLELQLEEDEISMEDLRNKMLALLDLTMKTDT